MVKRQILVKIKMSTHWPVFIKIKNAYFSEFCYEHAGLVKLELVTLSNGRALKVAVQN